MTHSDGTLEHLWSLIAKVRFAMFTTQDGSGHLTARPMTTQNKAIDLDQSLWFFMSAVSEPIADLTMSNEVGLVYVEPHADVYVSIAARASVLRDPAKVRELWSPLNAAWFPGGMDDPNLVLVRCKILSAYYWDIKQSKFVQLWTLAKAAATGRPPENMGEQGVVRVANSGYQA